MEGVEALGDALERLLFHVKESRLVQLDLLLVVEEAPGRHLVVEPSGRPLDSVLQSGGIDIAVLDEVACDSWKVSANAIDSELEVGRMEMICNSLADWPTQA
jgi:hypothetical protein